LEKNVIKGNTKLRPISFVCLLVNLTQELCKMKPISQFDKMTPN